MMMFKDSVRQLGNARRPSRHPSLGLDTPERQIKFVLGVGVGLMTAKLYSQIWHEQGYPVYYHLLTHRDRI